MAGNSGGPWGGGGNSGGGDDGRGGGRGQAKVLKDLGDHPDGGKMQVLDGRYGPYVKWEKVNATVPKGTAPEAVTVEQAVELIAAKKAKGGKKKAPAKKKAEKK